MEKLDPFAKLLVRLKVDNPKSVIFQVCQNMLCYFIHINSIMEVMISVFFSN